MDLSNDYDDDVDDFTSTSSSILSKSNSNTHKNSSSSREKNHHNIGRYTRMQNDKPRITQSNYDTVNNSSFNDIVGSSISRNGNGGYDELLLSAETNSSNEMKVVNITSSPQYIDDNDDDDNDSVDYITSIFHNEENNSPSDMYGMMDDVWDNSGDIGSSPPLFVIDENEMAYELNIDDSHDYYV